MFQSAVQPRKTLNNRIKKHELRVNEVTVRSHTDMNEDSNPSVFKVS